jgi:hypothetical protein
MTDHHKYQIPEEFKEQLTYTELQDNRTDEQILKSINEYRAVDSEKNVWAYWWSVLDELQQKDGRLIKEQSSSVGFPYTTHHVTVPLKL